MSVFYLGVCRFNRHGSHAGGHTVFDHHSGAVVALIVGLFFFHLIRTHLNGKGKRGCVHVQVAVPVFSAAVCTSSLIIMFLSSYLKGLLTSMDRWWAVFVFFAAVLLKVRLKQSVRSWQQKSQKIRFVCWGLWLSVRYNLSSWPFCGMISPSVRQ